MPDLGDLFIFIAVTFACAIGMYIIFLPPSSHTVPVIEQSGILDKMEQIDRSTYVVSFEDNLSDSKIYDVTPAQYQILSNAYEQHQYVTINSNYMNNTLVVNHVSVGTQPPAPVSQPKGNDWGYIAITTIPI